MRYFVTTLVTAALAAGICAAEESATPATSGSATTSSTESTEAETQAVTPERVIIMSGNRNGASQEVMAVMYDTSDLNFNDPRAPRFLFVDSKGKTALGIGGYVEASMQYDFDGAIDNPGFVTASIPVPSDPKLR